MYSMGALGWYCMHVYVHEVPVADRQGTGRRRTPVHGGCRWEGVRVVGRDGKQGMGVRRLSGRRANEGDGGASRAAGPGPVVTDKRCM